MMERELFIEERILALDLAKAREKELLDVGAGPLARIAAEQYDCYVTSIDTSGEALLRVEAEAEKQGVAEKISFELEDASDLTYCDDAFDIGICFCAVHHIAPEKRAPAIAELFRVVFERLVVAEFTPAGFDARHKDDPFVPVDLEWLKTELANLGPVTVHDAGEIRIFVLEKRVG
ncbi:MAG: class I SAM-dependent methyltransferase [Methanomicrobiaceae archaeon]|nr:class I SAM-dependent methyltransferase [Methanomicrobiaceae archaeon]